MSTSDNIIDAIAEFRVAFARENLNMPVAIILDSHDDGMRLMASMRQKQIMKYTPGEIGRPVEHPDGSVWQEIEIMGIKVRWPANRYATQAGDFIWY